MYLGYGVFGGFGFGFGYVLLVLIFIWWFFDWWGMVIGFVIMGFGGGVMIGVFFISVLFEIF